MRTPTPWKARLDGQIADSEIALLLGLTGAKPLRARLPLVQLPAFALIGPRAKDASVPTLEGRVFLWRDTAVRAAAARDLADAALACVAWRARRLWLHVDLDVLSSDAFGVHDFPEPGGIGWRMLKRLHACLICSVACAGWSQILQPYDQLRSFTPTAVAALNRPAALAEVSGPVAALAVAAELAVESEKNQCLACMSYPPICR